MSSAPLRWGILGTGHIARLFAGGLAESSNGSLAAVASRTDEAARRFGAEHACSRAYDSYEALLRDAEIHVVYIATPHPMHMDWCIRALEAGKHVLCEKPLAVNARDTEQMIATARRHRRFLMEAFMYRCHPQTVRLQQTIRSGAIGRIRALQATFSYQAPARLESRLFDPALGGGAILDVGCYAASIARLIAGLAKGRPFAEPLELNAHGHLGGESHVDEWTTAIARFPGDVLAQLAAGIRVKQDNTVRIYGSDGWIHVPRPWQPSKFGGEWSFQVHLNSSHAPEVVAGEESRSIYAVEADHVAELIQQNQLESPRMSLDDSLGNMQMLDSWRRRIGMSHPADRVGD